MLDHARELDDVAQLGLAPAPADVWRSERVREAAGPLREGRHLRLQRAVRLLPDALDAPELLVHPLERVLERPHVARKVRLGELEEARAVRVERLGRDRLHRACEPLVARTALHGELGLARGELAFELDDLLGSTPPLDERWTYGDEDDERPGGETDEQRRDDH